jgi:hypothetical protein
MSFWKQVEAKLVTAHDALRAVPPNVKGAQQLLGDLVQAVRNRKVSVPRVFDVNDLMKAVEHLPFDMYHFRCFSKLYVNETLRVFSPAASQAVRYSLLLHLRVLIDFFYNDASQDDCHVDHFDILPGFQDAFPASIHVHSTRTKEVSLNLNKLLAHMTATRWEKPRPPMNDYDEFGPTIDDLIAQFQNALPKALADVFVRHYQRWETAHPALMTQR